jgi:glycerol kinase
VVNFWSAKKEDGISILVIDVGSSSVRALVVRPDGSVAARHREGAPPSVPLPGLVEVDARAIATAVLEVAGACLRTVGGVDAIAIANQRGTTVVWDAASGDPIGPALSWQDLRTVGTCLELQGEGLRLAPNEAATKAAWLLDTYDAERSGDIRLGTLDTWVAWVLSEGGLHITDPSNAAVTGLLPTEDVLAGRAGLGWDAARLERLRIPASAVARIVSTGGELGAASALAGAPPIYALIGDQQASLVGQGCIKPGDAKATFGTGAFLDVNIGATPPAFGAHGKRGEQGCLPVIAWQMGAELVWGAEALMLSAGTALQWLVDDLQILSAPAQSAEVASLCDDTGDVVFVPALMGIGTPDWDFGARPLLIGMTAGVGRPQVVRAVLRGIAQRGADLLEAAEKDSGHTLAQLRLDGGMSQNPVFVQELADACGVPVAISSEVEATALGAAFVAGSCAGTWSSLQEAAALATPRAVVVPGPDNHRSRWKDAVNRSLRWYPELSELDF